MKTFWKISLLLLAGLPLPVLGQVSFGGTPMGTKADKIGLPKSTAVMMPQVDV